MEGPGDGQPAGRPAARCERGCALGSTSLGGGPGRGRGLQGDRRPVLLHAARGQLQAVARVGPQGAEQPPGAATAVAPRAVRSGRRARAVDPRDAAGRRPGDQPGLQAALEHDVRLVVALHVVGVQAGQRVRARQAEAAGRAVRRAAGAAGRAAAAHHVVALVGRLDRDDEVVAVGDHHVRDLVQRLPRHLDAVHLQHLVVHGQQPGALGQAAGHHARDEDAGHLLQPLRRHAHARAVADVEAQRPLAAVAEQPHAPVRLGHDVHVDDGRHRAEVARQADVQVRAPPRPVLAQRQRPPPPRQRARRQPVLRLLCKRPGGQ